MTVTALVAVFAVFVQPLRPSRHASQHHPLAPREMIQTMRIQLRTTGDGRMDGAHGPEARSHEKSQSRLTTRY